MARRTLRWLAIGSLIASVACGGETAAPRRATSPAEPLASEAPQGPAPASAPPSVPAPTVEIPPTVEAPPAIEPSAPPTVEPIAALPPCPADPRRDQARRPDDVVQLAQLSAAMTVVDLGSGDGYFLCRLSHAVGAQGHVIATEITGSLVRDLKKRAAREQLSNVEVVLAPTNDVGIAPGSADRILVVHVWHHLTDRKRYAARIARALAPGGKVAIVDFKPDRGSGHGIEPERILAELTAGGLDGTLIAEDLPDDYVIIASVRMPAHDAAAP